MSAVERLLDWPRRRLAHLPTPLLEAPNLRAALGPDTPEILVKMDAETGLGLGGNKVRKLEFVLAEGRLDGVTTVITAGGAQSNHCRVTAAAAARLGLRCILVLTGPEPTAPRGNALLHRLFGAEIRTVRRRDDREPAMQAVAEEVTKAGGRPMTIPIGASDALGSLAYAAAFLELEDQLASLPAREATWIFVSASSCGTVAGLLLGASIRARDDVRLVGVSADLLAFDLRRTAMDLARGGADMLEWDGEVREGVLAAADEYVGRGYGVPTVASREATDLFGAREGIVLDPVYSSKAAAGMLDWIRRGSVAPDHRVVFLHTGGHPALLV